MRKTFSGAFFALLLLGYGVSAQDVGLPQPDVPVNVPPVPAPPVGAEADVPPEAPKEKKILTDAQAAQAIASLAATQSPQDSGVKPSDIESVFFTFWEHAAIIDAKRTAAEDLDVRGVSRDEMERALRESGDEAKPKPPPEEREITLGGIVYTSGDDWTIWLNGQRVEPDAMPKEIIGLKVHKDFIEMKWLDDYTMQVYPIRLRAHQRFNLDTRIFLPG